jgi:UDP-4-amino-4,6-dideoxy-N-acetyl-beta-L-altrosamine transaminase
MIPYGRQDIDQSDLDAVMAVLRSDFLTQGEAVPRFERAVSERVGAKHAVAANSATSALHLACAALDLRSGDSLWTVPNTFVASANCARYCGADVDFVDIDPRTWNIDVGALERKLVRAAKSNRIPKVIVPVHFAGQPTDQPAIWELSRKFGFKILEDASHAIGASFDGEPVGSCRWSDITVFSFHPVKIITSGEGGMALTNDASLAARMRLLRSHGISRDPSLFENCADTGAWSYQQLALGFNYRMTDIHAALGASQLARLAGYVERRNQLAERYSASLQNLPLMLPLVSSRARSAFHLYVVRVSLSDVVRSRKRVFDALRARQIGVNVHYTPVHLQPYYRSLGFHEGQFPNAEAYGDSAITLPLYPSMTELQQETVISAVRETL